MLKLPISPRDFVSRIMAPALDLLPGKMGSIEARVMVLAIALQESGLAHRWQIVDPAQPWIKGSARGLMQFERDGGVLGVLTHAASRDYAAGVCRARGVVAAPQPVYDALDQDDILAVALGRLLLWTDPHRLPAVDDTLGGWDLYQRVWRPGKPQPETWARHDATARTALGVASP